MSSLFPQKVFLHRFYVLKNQFIWKNKQNHLMFPLKSSFNLMFLGRMWPAGRVFETPAVKYMLETGAHIDTIDENNWTSLIIASEFGHLEIVKYLIEKGASIKAKDDRNWTSLFHAK